jgi:hypothetical protein
VSRVLKGMTESPEPQPHVTLDPDSLNPVERKLREPLEEQLSSALQAAAHRVRDSYHGEPVEQVQARLLAETRAGLHPDVAEGFHPDPDQLRAVAEAIVRG